MQRFGKNHGGYHGEMINIREVLRDIEVVAKERGWSAEVFHSDGDFNWLALHRVPSRTAQQSQRGERASGFIAMNPGADIEAWCVVRGA